MSRFILNQKALKGLCGKFPEYDGPFDDKQRWDILNDILKLRDEDRNQE